MSTPELCILGTSSQVPTRHRNHNGYFVRWGPYGFLFDPGEGTQRQMTLAGIAASDVTHVVITHFHGDHCLGLPGIVQRLSLDQVGHPVELIHPASGAEYLDRLRYASIFVERAEVTPRPIYEDGVVLENDQVTIRAQRLEHTVDCFGYRIEGPSRWNLDPAALRRVGVAGPAAGQLKREGQVQVDGRVIRREEVGELRRGPIFALVMDSRRCPAAVELARDADVLLCESTYLQSEADVAYERGHMTALDAARVAAEAGARRLVLTHFSQRHPDEAAFVREASSLHTDVIAAVEGLRVPIRLPPLDGCRS